MSLWLLPIPYLLIALFMGRDLKIREDRETAAATHKWRSGRERHMAHCDDRTYCYSGYHDNRHFKPDYGMVLVKTALWPFVLIAAGALWLWKHGLAPVVTKSAKAVGRGVFLFFEDPQVRKERKLAR